MEKHYKIHGKATLPAEYLCNIEKE